MSRDRARQAAAAARPGVRCSSRRWGWRWSSPVSPWGSRSPGPGPGPSREVSCGPTAPKLSVVGTGQASVSPDLLTVVVQVDAGDPSAAAALATDDTEAAAALTTFEAGGVRAEDISTSGLSLQPQYAYPRGIPTVTGYAVDNTVTATLRDISKSGSIVDAVVGSAGNALRIESIGFSSADPSLGQDARPGHGPASEAEAHARRAARAAGTITRAGVHPDRPVDRPRRPRLRPGRRREDASAGAGPDRLGPADPDGAGLTACTPSDRLGKIRRSRPTSRRRPDWGIPMPRTAPVHWPTLVDDYGQASVLVDEVPPELVDRANLAIANCPEYAIASLGD